MLKEFEELEIRLTSEKHELEKRIEKIDAKLEVLEDLKELFPHEASKAAETAEISESVEKIEALGGKEDELKKEIL